MVSVLLFVKLTAPPHRCTGYKVALTVNCRPIKQQDWDSSALMSCSRLIVSVFGRAGWTDGGGVARGRRG